MTDQLIIRPSTLPGIADCHRRAVARAHRKMIEGAGYALRNVARNIGAVVGTAVHAGCEYTLSAKLVDGTLGNDAEAEDRAITTYGQQVAEGVNLDDTTPIVPDGQKQIARMVKTYRRNLAPKLQPVLVERRFYAAYDTDVVLSGQMDSLTMEPGKLRDTKTGTIRRPNQAQYGAYAMILDANGHAVGGIAEDYIPRVRLSKDQPAPQSYDVNIDVAVGAAAAMIDRHVDAVREFNRRIAADDKPPEWAFVANPQSMLCGDKWCPAWGTTFCKEHKR